MNNNQNLRSLQSKIADRVEQVDNCLFLNQLSNPQLLSTAQKFLPEHRERKYPPLETLSMFLHQAMSADRSCQNIVNTIAVQRKIKGEPYTSTHTGSYCKARQKLPLPLISELTRHTGNLVQDQLPTKWQWKGRPVKLVDGSTLSMPDTHENQAIYPQPSEQAPGVGFPICRISAIICLASGSIINATMGRFKGKGADELTMLRGMLDSLNIGDILLGDALYSSYFMIASILDRSVDIAFEQQGARKKTTDFRTGKKIGKKDHLITYNKPAKPDWMTQEHYDTEPDTLTVREIKVGDKIIVTTMLDSKKYSKKSLEKLYKERWNVELDLRNIKTTMGLETLSCKTPEMVEKEMWVYLLGYNIIRLLMIQSAYMADILPRQISFKHTLQIYLAYRLQGDSSTKKDIDSLCLLIVENTVGNRPGRIEPRKVKRRPKQYKLLQKPRSEERIDIKKNGHPPKQR